MGNSPYNIPDNWIWSSMGEAFTLILGQSPPSSTYNENEIGLPFFQGKAEFGEFYPEIRKWCSQPKKIAEKGDVLLSVRAPVGPTNLTPQRSCIGRGLAAIRGVAGVQPLFILYLVRAFENSLKAQTTGTTFAAITGKRLEKIPIPLPPIAEQVRIVAKIEELFSRLDQGVKTLQETQQKIEQYRQSIFREAFNGKLTEKWRQEKYVEKIDYFTKSREKQYWDIPSIWKWKHLEKIAEINPKLPIDELTDDFEVSFIPMRNVEEETGKIDLSITKSYKEVKTGFTKFVDGDIIFAKITPCMENGKVALVKNLKNTIGFGSTEFHVIRLQQNSSKKFYYYYVLQQWFRKIAELTFRGAVGQRRVPTDFFKKVYVPCPSLDEQNEIVSVVEKNNTIIDETTRQIIKSIKNSAIVKQSILKVAFSGGLVLQDPSDEPASVLFKKIKAEKDKLKPKGGRGRNKN